MNTTTVSGLAAPRDGRALATGWPARIAIAGILALVILPLLPVGSFVLSIGTTAFITAIAAASLHLLIRTGHVSMGHAAFMGIGAYASVLVTMKLQLPFAAGLVAAFVAPAILALLIGPLVLRLAGKYFVLVTFLFGEIVRMVFVEWTTLTGGANGIPGVPPPHPRLLDPQAYYYFALGFAIVLIGFIARLLSSEIGRSIDAIREGENLAECSGVPVLRVKVCIFALSCGIVGIAGALQGHFIRYIDPTSFSMVQSLNLVVVNVIGGMYALVGPIIGTAFFMITPELLRDYVELQRVIFGIIIIVVIAFFPGGLVEIAQRRADALRGKRKVGP
ncbi:branched-chain amino acid ABC transporter permease [Reyranella sp. CPCC 100927]|uniref:branched-chain amino acid ABC transporter permease n=1 Tax=Reyranella sp. CPCC 100927 TaxID=2599616 RepID=UPI0011B6BEDA|nr:branched-chain amino acid ABC transporter permease [Reyranella sp. CPCC 100927]TWS98477.1 branched-chain amino acid ABC transporter permease [Reyranella sp. CPCC 100927]